MTDDLRFRRRHRPTRHVRVESRPNWRSVLVKDARIRPERASHNAPWRHPSEHPRLPVGGGQLQQAQRPARQLSRAPESAICSREDPSPLSRSVARWGPLRSSLGAKVRRDGVMTEVPDQTIIPKRRTFRSKRPFCARSRLAGLG
jgi:hypothetical protein